ncbi:Oxidoreductase swnR [Phytophthora citrophthora]|uniref:Oxidoreductase swnR n=1 Tax=Phytophthora citrophthora TaxID=4793 RepID=A0AAD9GLK8_9STRA|nr:Oxidoreductase swnR [Phytophthora citrophthora]
MRVAIVGTGAFAKYFINEFTAAGIEVVVLTRSHKDFLDGKKGVVEQRITDYSNVSELAEALKDCDALVSTIFDEKSPSAETHLNLLEACIQSPKCKRFIPSEYGGNEEDFSPEEVSVIYGHNEPLKKALKEQNDVEYTFVSLGWVADYIVPKTNRYHGDIGPLHPLDLHTRTMSIPGTGNDMFSLTSARDMAKAIAELLKSSNKWRPYTYVQGSQVTWLQLAELMKTTGGMPDLKVVFEPLEEIKKQLENKELFLIASFKLLAPSGGCTFDQGKVERDRAEHFPNVHLRTAKELLEAVKQDPKVVV